ncbi:MAG: calcium-translocating P-type ATPase, PMCA-type [Synergistaceae bacterium]|nr:calcium-translocating P-type ATPase, PMCA-type [Synergistaceae bacterium]
MKRYEGLTSREVLESREIHGENTLTPPARAPWWRLYLEKYDDPVIRILLIAACIAFLAGLARGEYLEAVGIVVAIFLATTMAFINEYKAGKEFDILNRVSDDVGFEVIRDGEYRSVPRRDLVVGDILLLETGEEVPADASVLEAVSLQVDESTLTGESAAVTKLPEDDPRSAGIQSNTAYPSHLVYRGTMVQDGHGVFRIDSVGDATEIGRTAKEAYETPDERTPLSRRLDGLSKVIGVVGFGVAAVLFVSLSLHAKVSGELEMDRGQWIFSLVLAATFLVASVRVWLPIVYDAIDLLGRERRRPEWLEKEGVWQWVKPLLFGAAFFVVASLASYLAGVLPSSLGEYLNVDAGRKFLQFFMISITLIVVAVPEGLAMSVTLSLAYSMRKMTASNNLVRKLHACETIGAATVICTDKTGTLTQNRMRVHELSVPAYSTSTDLLYEAMAANSTANLSKSSGETEVLGNPTEGALLMWLYERGEDYRRIRGSFDVIDQLPFSTERKFMATLGRGRDGLTTLHAKGAPEILMERCSRILLFEGSELFTDDHKEEIMASVRSFQRRGMRVIGLASRRIPEGTEGDASELSGDLTWLGFAAISDPVRDDVPAAIRSCAEAGIEVKIVTGDNRETAREIARQIGLIEDGVEAEHSLLTGDEFEELVDRPESRGRMLDELKVMSRARPSHKLKLVKALQERGEVVAVTGDGTNDAPALNHANVGLSMGKRGTAVAKEASDIILLDDSFTSIVNAIMWGRGLYQNIQRFILFQLTVNVSAMAIVLLGPVIGIELPLTVIQMLWVNLIMDTFAALALATEPPHPEVMRAGPRNPDSFIVTPEMARGIFGYGALFVVAMASMLLFIRGGGVSSRELTVFFSVFVMLQVWNLFNARRMGLSSSSFSGLRDNRWFIGIVVLIVAGQVLMVQLGGGVFRTVPLSVLDWVLIIIATSPVILIGEALRFLARRGETARAT